jgi:hypothetical protein
MTHKISIADALTGETIEREMTADELAIYEADTARRLKIYQAAEKANAEKAAIKAEVLAKLGLTAEEAQALGL